MSESIALIISALALAVAGYGILERRAAAYAALRVRITELIGDIGELNVEEARIESDQGAGETAASDDDGPIEFISQRGYMETMASLSGRRALLTYQVLSLLARLRPRRLVRRGSRLTASEHGLLADSLCRLADYGSAKSHWEAAIVSSQGNSDFLRVSSRCGYAAMLWTAGDIDAARHQFNAALASVPPRSTAARVQALNIYGRWIYAEMTAPGGYPAEPTRRAYALAQEDDLIREPALEALRHITTRASTVDGVKITTCLLDDVAKE